MAKHLADSFSKTLQAAIIIKRVIIVNQLMKRIKRQRHTLEARTKATAVATVVWPQGNEQ